MRAIEFVRLELYWSGTGKRTVNSFFSAWNWERRVGITGVSHGVGI